MTPIFHTRFQDHITSGSGEYFKDMHDGYLGQVILASRSGRIRLGYQINKYNIDALPTNIIKYNT